MSRLVPVQHYISSHYIKLIYLIYLIYQLAQQAYIILYDCYIPNNLV